jgi:hypothetical protein
MNMNAGGIRAVVAAALVASASLLGCTTATGPDSWERDLSSAESRWQVAALHNYTLSMIRSCHCVTAQTRPVTVVVRNGAFASLVFADSLGGVADTTLFQQYLTVDRYFSLLHLVVASGPYAFGATYNQSLGFPILVTVDPDRTTTGEEFQVEIYAFTANTP